MSTGPAPAMECGTYGRTIGKGADHYLVRGQEVRCHRCFGTWAYATFRAGRDDTDYRFGTRAAIADMLGLWP